MSNYPNFFVDRGPLMSYKYVVSIPEHGEIPWRTRRCKGDRELRGKATVMPVTVTYGKAAALGTILSQKTC